MPEYAPGVGRMPAPSAIKPAHQGRNSVSVMWRGGESDTIQPRPATRGAGSNQRRLTARIDMIEQDGPNGRGHDYVALPLVATDDGIAAGELRDRLKK